MVKYWAVISNGIDIPHENNEIQKHRNMPGLPRKRGDPTGRERHTRMSLSSDFVGAFFSIFLYTLNPPKIYKLLL